MQSFRLSSSYAHVLHGTHSSCKARGPLAIVVQRARGMCPAVLHRSPVQQTRSAATYNALPFSNPRSGLEVGEKLRMLAFGKPGSGKGTLSGRLIHKYDILTLSTGDLLRQHIAEGTDVGRKAKEIVAQGGLLDDDIILKVVTSKLDDLHNKNWILDGFPRTLVQGQLLDAHLKTQGMPLTLIVNLDVPDEVILSRISDRWIHPASGRTYNMSYNRPNVNGLDDETGEALARRPDDNPEVFERRLKQFYASTAPLLDHYKLEVVSLKGHTSDEIWPHLDALVKNTFPTLKERTEFTEARRQSSLSDAVIAEETKQSQPVTLEALRTV